MAVDAATVRAAITEAGDAVAITHRPCALAGWGGRALDAAEARRILEGASTGARLDDARERFSRIYVPN